MTRLDPASALPRTDLPWLRRRRPVARPAAAPVAPPRAAPVAPPRAATVAPPAAAPLAPRADLLAPPATASQAAPATPPAPPPPPTDVLDLGAPVASGSLDLGPAVRPGANALDLGPPPTAPPTAPATSQPPAVTGAAAATTSTPYRPRRVLAGQDVVLTRSAPTLTLTRLQSGTGSLRVRLVASEAVGDILLGCAYQLSDGTSLVRRVPGPPTAPPDGHRPVIRASRDNGEVITVDLVQVRRLSRMVVYAYSASGQPVHWGGTLTIEMLAGTRLRLPLDRVDGASGGVLVPLSVYNVDGELVLRHEGVVVEGSARSVALAFGFDRITWVDDHTPLV